MFVRIEKNKTLYNFQILLRKIAGLWLYCFSPFVLQAQILPPEIRDKTLYKLEIPKEGIYEINYTTLKEIGLNTQEINLDYLHIYGNWEKQDAFFTNKNEFLTALPITVIKGNNGVFNYTDKIIFYAAGPHKLELDVYNKAYAFKENPYSKSAYVYLMYDESRQSKRIETKKNIIKATANAINIVQTFVHHEVNERNLINSGNVWLGERIADNSCETLDFTLPNAILGNVKILFSVASQARQQAHLKITVNGLQDTIQFSPLQAGVFSPKA